jgi:alkanesulfonate monooxygenase SsuD/methylene tetrahydromethanopterin reductase-like flavin-dependent oxidoreductase (luciferase family)
MGSVRVGYVPTPGMLPGRTHERREFVGRILDEGIDHLGVIDHVSFLGGTGFDGLITATSLLSLDDRACVHVGVYLLPLRNPVTVARQLSSIAEMAPGRLVFGVGIGGEDRHEYDICGVDSHTRGARMEETLPLLRRLLSGEPVTHHGRFFDIDGARILPAPDPGIPLIVGGRSPAAISRAARLADGWIGIWVSPRRFAEVLQRICDEAAQHGREHIPWQHELTVWCGFGPRPDLARQSLAVKMETLYKTPFAQFERYCPAGSPEDVAEFLSHYVTAGCTTFNLLAEGPDEDSVVRGVAQVRKLLAEH